MNEMTSNARLSTTLGLAFGLLAAVASAQGPVGHWPLDGDGVDISGNGLDGTIEGNVVAAMDRDGVSNAALEFGGTSADLVDVGDPTELQLSGAMTLAAWAYLDSGNTNNARIIAKMGGGGSRSWSLCAEADMDGIPNRGNFQISPDGNEVISAPTQGSVPTDEWFHLAGVYRPGQAMEIYLNGQPDNAVTAGIPASQFSSNGQPVYIGNRVACGNCGWVGSLDDVRVYDRALDAGEILDLYSGATTPTAPSDLNASAVNARIIALTWADNATNETGVEIQRKEGVSGTYAMVATVGQDVTFYNDVGLNPETTYFYRVRAVNAAGQSAWSNEANATTPASSLGVRRWHGYR